MKIVINFSDSIDTVDVIEVVLTYLLDGTDTVLVNNQEYSVECEDETKFYVELI